MTRVLKFFDTQLILFQMIENDDNLGLNQLILEFLILLSFLITQLNIPNFRNLT